MCTSPARRSLLLSTLVLAACGGAEPGATTSGDTSTASSSTGAGTTSPDPPTTDPTTDPTTAGTATSDATEDTGTSSDTSTGGAEATPCWPFDAPPLSDLRAAPKKVFAHYFSPYPISIDNKDPAVDYYQKNYLQPTGENSKFAYCGGFIKQRPLPQAPRPADVDYELANFEQEVRRAAAIGLDGFTYDILNTSGTHWDRLLKLLDAAANVDPEFRIVLMPDMSATYDGADMEAQVAFVDSMLAVASHPSVYRVDGGPLMLAPFAAAWLVWSFSSGQPTFGDSSADIVLIAVAGVVTTVPLLLFTAAARRLPYSMLGMLQFIAPTLQFLIAVLLYGEPFTTAHAIAFGAIWAALGLYVLAVVRHARARRVGDGDAAGAIDVHDPGHAEDRVGAEVQGVEEVVVDPLVDHVHASLAVGGAHVHLVGAGDQVTALHELHAHHPGQQRVLEVRRVVDARGEHDDDGILDVGWRRFPQRGQQAPGVFLDRTDVDRSDRLRQALGHRPPVLQHVGDARGHPDVVLQDAEGARGVADDVDAGDVHADPAGGAEAVDGAVEVGARGDQRPGHHPVAHH